MRKLRKMNLDELAQEMPVLSEEEQRAHEGGAFYYTMSGDYLGKVGDSNEIRIISADTYYNLSGNANGVGMDVVSSNFSFITSNDVKFNVLNSMARSVGVGSGFNMANLEQGTYAEIDISGNVSFSYHAPCFRDANYYDFVLTLYHERRHIETSYLDHRRSEFEAYACVLRHPQFEQASEKFKNTIVNNYIYYKDTIF